MGKFIALSIVAIVVVGAIFSVGLIVGLAAKPVSDQDIQKFSETYSENYSGSEQ